MRLDINYRKKSVKNTNTWRLNNTLLDNQEISEEVKEEIKKYLETNDNENMMTQNLWDAEKAILRGKFIAIQSHLKKQETSNTILPQIKQPNLTPKAIRERKKEGERKEERKKKKERKKEREGGRKEGREREESHI